MMKLPAAIFFWPVLAVCQVNLQFQQGTPGQPPPGWFTLEAVKAVKDGGYSAAWSREGCRTAGTPCAVLAAPANPAPQSFGNLMQSFDARPFRGQTVRLRAWVRVEGQAAGDHAQLLLHVGRPGAMAGFVDNMGDRPIVSAEWKSYEIRGEVEPDAESIRIALLLYGKGRAWLSEVEFAALAETTAGPEVKTAQDAIQRQYDRIDSAYARSAGDEIAAAVLPDAQIGVGSVREPLLPAIQAEIGKGSRMAAKTTVMAVRVLGDEAVATVLREASDPATKSAASMVTRHRDTWVHTAAGWRWKESIELSFHWVVAPTSPAAAEPVISELKSRAVPLRTVEDQAPADDLAAFGQAVGDARIVALGGDSRGTREFYQLKLRLMNYLARTKGFKVLIVVGSGPVGTDVNPALSYAGLPAGDPQTVAAQVVKLAEQTYPKARIVLWAAGGDVRAAALRERFGRDIYVAGFGFHRGAVRAVGVADGKSRGLDSWPVPPSPAGSGDTVLSGAGLPLFFLSMTDLPAGGELALWLAQTHLFHDVGAYWVLDDVDASLQPLVLGRSYDGWFFVEEAHAGA